MHRIKAKGHRYTFFWIVSLCTILIACGGGPADQNTNDGAGQGSHPNNPQASPPSACIPDHPTGPDLYVATNGNDDPNHDGSTAAPYATITYALDRARDGTVILVRPGTY